MEILFYQVNENAVKRINIYLANYANIILKIIWEEFYICNARYTSTKTLLYKKRRRYLDSFVTYQFMPLLAPDEEDVNIFENVRKSCINIFLNSVFVLVYLVLLIFKILFE